MPDIVIAVLIGCALGFGIGYAVRERVSRERHRRHRWRDIY
jgi:NhaP-type Na+/H+ or K+/H+ antiporter